MDIDGSWGPDQTLVVKAGVRFGVADMFVEDGWL